MFLQTFKVYQKNEKKWKKDKRKWQFLENKQLIVFFQSKRNFKIQNKKIEELKKHLTIYQK